MSLESWLGFVDKKALPWRLDAVGRIMLLDVMLSSVENWLPTDTRRDDFLLLSLFWDLFVSFVSFV